MNCRKVWSREIQIRELTATFVNGPLKKHTENILFEGQRALLPATLEIYEREHKIKISFQASRKAASSSFLAQMTRTAAASTICC
jgi:hypothetical protein